MVRSDLSDNLIHLTKGDTPFDILASILTEQKLKGGTGFIKGGYKCVCFSEAPISQLAQIIASPGHQFKYKPYGVMVNKLWFFSKGGLPVIYQPDSHFSTLPENMRYRHVRFEPNIKVDLSWEREWRLLADELILDPAECTIILPNRTEVDAIHDSYMEHLENEIKQSEGTIKLERCPWHFIALEDLGVTIPEDV